MKSNDWLIGFLLVIIIVLSLALVDSRMSIQNNVRAIEVQANQEKIIFVGDSITDKYDLNYYYNYDNKLVINSGIGGYKTTNIISRFDNLIEQHAANKMFLMIGTNDLGAGTDKDQIVENIIQIIAMTRDQSPTTKIYYETIYPVNRSLRSSNDKRYNDDIKYINKKMKEYCSNSNVTYIDIYSALLDEDENLSKEYTEDGLHLNEYGYDVVTDILRTYVEA